MRAEDGSVRVLCATDDLNQDLNNGVRALAFDSTGKPLAGWPVDVHGYWISGLVIGDALTLFASRSLGDVEVEGQPISDGGIVTIGADGTTSDGARVTGLGNCCRWVLGPDRIAYGTVPFDSAPTGGSGEASQISALDSSGVRPGWPVTFDGSASDPALRNDGRIVLVVASIDRTTSRVLVFDDDGQRVSASSAELPIETAVSPGTTGGCTPSYPIAPLVASDGTIFVFSEIDDAVFALDPALDVRPGWPYRPATPLGRRDPRLVREDAFCSVLGVPGVGPDGALYVPLQARDSTVGGSLVAIGADGTIRPGWPVELRRPGAEFWSVVVGSDGTAYALAIEPEAGDTSSASILAIAPDSSVLYTTTIIEP